MSQIHFSRGAGHRQGYQPRSTPAALQTLAAKPRALSNSTPAGLLLQRQCACGASQRSSHDKCEDCQSRALQLKRLIESGNDRSQPTAAANSALPISGSGRVGHDLSRVSVFDRNDASELHRIARKGVAGTGSPVPFQNDIQPLMPGLDLSTIHAHSGAATDAALQALGANGYASGDALALPANPSRHLVAHELAHIAQQRNGLTLNQGIGEEGDAHEVAANAIADRVADGRSAAELMPAGRAPHANGSLQFDIRAPRQQADLNEEAEWLGRRQAKRRVFWEWLDDIGNFYVDLLLQTDKFRDMLIEHDTQWIPPPRPLFGMRQARGKFQRAAYVDDMEHEVMFNREARLIYNRALSDGVNKPKEKSTFDRIVGFVCEHTSPCKENMEQYHADLAGGMSVEDARARGIFRTAAWGAQQGLSISPQGSKGPPNESAPNMPGTFRVPVPVTPGGPAPIARGTPANPGPVAIPIPPPSPTRPTVKPSPPIETPKPAPPAAAPKPTSPTATSKPTPTGSPTPESVPWPSTPPMVPPAVSMPKGNEDPKLRKCGDRDLPLTVVTFFPGPQGQGGGVKASPLTRCPGTTVGSKPDEKIYKDQFDCLSSAGESRNWLRGHILHGETDRTGKRNLHGPGDTIKNLIIIDQSLNQAMNSWIEKVILDLLYGPYPHVLWLRAWVDSYHPGLPFFADAISIHYGPYDTKSGKEGPTWNKGQFTIKKDRKPPACT